MDDEQALRELNQEMTNAENNGKKEWFATILAPSLAFQRANPKRTVVDRDTFLSKVQGDGTRETVSIGPISIHGNRAIVECVIADGDRKFHNLRLFIRRTDRWKLLGWANEPLPYT